MCGRYFVDDETARDIERILHQIDQKVKRGDVYPSEKAPVIRSIQGEHKVEFLQWGYPMSFQRSGSNSKRVINARAESALTKRMFSEDVIYRRCLIPSSGFYEWDRDKTKYTFKYQNKTMYMAGLYHDYGDTPCFVVLTTQANESMKPVHNRMPLIFPKEQAGIWLGKTDSVGELLKIVPPLLQRFTPMEQMRLPL